VTGVGYTLVLVSSEEIPPENALWMLEAPKLVIVDGVGFVIKLVADRDAQTPERVLDPAAFLRYEIRGPVKGNAEMYLWLGTAMEEFMTDPTTDAPEELTANAQQAFEMWLAWSHGNES
jgi:hypothetical protein